MPHIVQCPGCKAPLQVSDESLEVELRCSQCRRTFRETSAAVQVSAPVVRPPVFVSPPAPQAAGGLIFDRRTTPPPSPETLDRGVEELSRGRERYADAPDFTAMPPVVRPLAGLGRATAACVLIGLAMIFEAAGVVVAVLFLRQLSAGAGALRWLEIAREITDTLFGAANLFAAVFFLMWMYSAHANLRLLRARGLRYSPGWAVIYFFIPFLNLVRPIQVVQEIWRASNPEAPLADPYAWRDSRGSIRAGFWWAFWLLGNVLANLSYYSSASPNANIDQLRIGTVMAILSAMFSIFAGVLIISVIRAIRKRQLARFERVLAIIPP